MNFAQIKDFFNLLKWDSPVNVVGSLISIVTVVGVALHWLLPLLGGVPPPVGQ